MSLYVKHSTVMNDASCLVKALEKRFKKVEYHHNNPQLMNGYGLRNQKAEIIVRKQADVYEELGFARDTSTGNFTAVMSDDNRKYGKVWLQNLSKDYLVEKANALMAEQESDLVEQEAMQDGSIRLRYLVHAHA